LWPVGPGYRLSQGFRETEWHPFVDGVFIPDEVGENNIASTSGQQIFLPKCTGRTWGPIWSRRRVDNKTAIDSDADFWGTMTLRSVNERLNQCDIGLIGLHSNVGITFDLEALRLESGKDFVEFFAVVANLDNSVERVEHDPEWVKSKRSLTGNCAQANLILPAEMET